MIMLYCKFPLIEEMNADILLKRCFNWVSGMQSVMISDTFRHLDWSPDKTLFKYEENETSVEYARDPVNRVMAFRFKSKDQNDEVWITDIAFNENTHIFQLRLACEKTTVDMHYNGMFHLPYFLRKLIDEGFGGNDGKLPVTDKAICITSENIDIVADIINGDNKYSLPVVFVTRSFVDSKTVVDVDELAKDLAGTAHVLVESCTEISKELKDLTQESNPYNGAVDIFYADRSYRLIKEETKTKNQFRWKIAYSIYRRTAMLNIDEEVSLSQIRTNLLLRQLNDRTDIEESERKQQEAELEKTRFYDMYQEERKTAAAFYADYDDMEAKLREAEAKVANYEARFAADKSDTGNIVQLLFSEEEFYTDEIRDILLENLQYSSDQMGGKEKSWRHYHVIKNILESNLVSNRRNDMRNELVSILKKDRLSKTDYSSLADLGFIIEHGGGHKKLKFHGDDRYTVTVASTPEDSHTQLNTAKDAEKLIFGRKY